MQMVWGCFEMSREGGGGVWRVSDYQGWPAASQQCLVWFGESGSRHTAPPRTIQVSQSPQLTEPAITIVGTKSTKSESQKHN